MSIVQLFPSDPKPKRKPRRRKRHYGLTRTATRWHLVRDDDAGRAKCGIVIEDTPDGTRWIRT